MSRLRAHQGTSVQQIDGIPDLSPLSNTAPQRQRTAGNAFEQPPTRLREGVTAAAMDDYRSAFAVAHSHPWCCVLCPQPPGDPTCASHRAQKSGLA